MRGPTVTRRRCAAALVLGAGAWPLVARVARAAPDAKGAAVAPAASPAERCRALIALAGTLVATARSGSGAATRFRIDVAYYRETLRALMKEDAARPEAERLPRPLLLEMVRMVALLQAAAECQTGRHIVCPADLIERLERQQRAVDTAAARGGIGR